MEAAPRIPEAPAEPVGLASLPDADLAERAREDPEAFGVLYRRYVGQVHTFAYRRTRSREAAEDVTAATFEAALRALPSFEPHGGGFAAWLFRIAANQLVDHYRRAGRPGSERGLRAARVLVPEDGSDMPDADERLDRLDREADVSAMLSALAALRPRYQRALSLRFLAGLDHGEAAAALGCSKATMAVTVHRALGALRRTMEAQPPREDPE